MKDYLVGRACDERDYFDRTINGVSWSRDASLDISGKKPGVYSEDEKKIWPHGKIRITRS
jgi:hypothetical protein